MLKKAKIYKILKIKHSLYYLIREINFHLGHFFNRVYKNIDLRIYLLKICMFTINATKYTKSYKNIQINIHSLVIRYNELRFVVRENCLCARKTAL